MRGEATAGSPEQNPALSQRQCLSWGRAGRRKETWVAFALHAGAGGLNPAAWRTPDPAQGQGCSFLLPPPRPTDGFMWGFLTCRGPGAPWPPPPGHLLQAPPRDA